MFSNLHVRLRLSVADKQLECLFNPLSARKESVVACMAISLFANIQVAVAGRSESGWSPSVPHHQPDPAAGNTAGEEGVVGNTEHRTIGRESHVLAHARVAVCAATVSSTDR